VRQTLTNASREGARAAVVYNVDPVTKLIIDAAARTKLATDAVDNYLQDPVTGRKFLTSWTRTVTFPDGGTNTGQRLTVTVTSPSGLLLLPKLLPAFDKINLASETTMRLE
jgi:Flp pilus assembly protein TadG